MRRVQLEGDAYDCNRGPPSVDAPHACQKKLHPRPCTVCLPHRKVGGPHSTGRPPFAILPAYRPPRYRRPQTVQTVETRLGVIHSRSQSRRRFRRSRGKSLHQSSTRRLVTVQDHRRRITPPRYQPRTHTPHTFRHHPLRGLKHCRQQRLQRRAKMLEQHRTRTWRQRHNRPRFLSFLEIRIWIFPKMLLMFRHVTPRVQTVETRNIDSTPGILIRNQTWLTHPPGRCQMSGRRCPTPAEGMSWAKPITPGKPRRLA